MMEEDTPVSRNRVVAYSCWLVVGGLLAAGWGTFLFGGSPVAAVLFGLTGCAASAMAATKHIRCYMSQLGRLVTLCNAGDVPQEAVRPYRVR